MRALKLMALVAVVNEILALSGAQAQTTAPTLKIGIHAEHGEYLTDRSGISLYMFEEDRPEGHRGRSVESDCLDDCLERWPVFGSDDPPKAEDGADASLVGSFKRPDDKSQATYNGWPLYYFAEDFVPGDINGHDIEEFGGEWYL